MHNCITRQNKLWRTTRLTTKWPRTSQKHHLYPYNIQHKSPLIVKPCKASIQDIQTVTYFVGKGIILFTMFYCTLNWWFYKTEREREEERDKHRD